MIHAIKWMNPEHTSRAEGDTGHTVWLSVQLGEASTGTEGHQLLSLRGRTAEWEGTLQGRMLPGLKVNAHQTAHQGASMSPSGNGTPAQTDIVQKHMLKSS